MSKYVSSLSDVFQPDQVRRYQVDVLNAVLAVQSNQGLIPVKVNPDDLPMTVPENRYQQLAQEFNHETAGFVAAWRELLPEELRPYGYLGMTSSNLIDCARAIAAREFTRRVVDYFEDVFEPALIEKIYELDEATRAGRTHGQVAAPVFVQSVYETALDRIHRILRDLTRSLPPGALMGPVGNPDQRALPLPVRESVGHCLRIDLDRFPTQIADRQRWTSWAFQLYQLIAACEQVATHHRLESISGIDRFSEKFEDGVQRGSSSMPHKRNPIRSERICGLSRVARGHLMALLETVTCSWWERDLTNSSVEKTALADLVDLTGFILQETAEVVQAGKWSTGGEEPDARWFSHARLVESQLQGLNPDEGAYTRIQEDTSAQD